MLCLLLHSPSLHAAFDKCFLYAQHNSLPIDQIEFPKKLRDYIPQSIHIKGIILLNARLIIFMNK